MPNPIKLLFIAVICHLFFAGLVNAQTLDELPGTNVDALNDLAEKWSAERQLNLQKALEVAEESGSPIRIEHEDGSIMELQGISESGQLLYYKTGNLDAARTVSTDLVWPLGGLGYTLSGDSMTIHEWDGGGVRTTHQEFTGRVTQQDAPSGLSDHATHVAGTIMAAGTVSAAKGMAYEADLDAYDWNDDLIEMATAAGNGMIISNHSYGYILGFYYNSSDGNWYWYGETSISQTEDYRFGFYNDNSVNYDQLALNAPYYLICKSAGNDRGDYTSGTHRVWNGSNWVGSNTNRDPDGGASGYDCVGDIGSAKNILTVGAVNAIPTGYSQPSDVVMSSFSGWGPTDDGRIKPDIVANGVGVFSSLAGSNSSYASWNGTSMSTPSAAGSILLIQQHSKRKRKSYLKAATLKGLIIHTASEAGTDPGPDYQNGWGLLNTAEAVHHITNDSSEQEIIETTLYDGQTYEVDVICDGNNPLWVTISWADQPGTPATPSLDPTNLMLVNDLDLRVIYKDTLTTFSPYVLNPSQPGNAATTGDNFRDNVEQVYIANPSAGTYTIQITHKSSLASAQDFSILSTGAVIDSLGHTCSNVISKFPYVENFESYAVCNNSPGASCLLQNISGWENISADSIDWTVHTGTTPTNLTGPTSSYNQGSGAGQFLYMESSLIGNPTKMAILESPCFDFTTLTDPEIIFAYHMEGSDMGSLSLQVNDGLSWRTVWFASGDHGSGWQSTNVDLSVYAGDSVKMRFVGVTGTGELSDIGLDEIKIMSTPQSCLKVIETFPYNEDFESLTLCSDYPADACALDETTGWRNELGDNIDWTVDNGGTGSSNTGPSTDYNPGNSTGNYLYTEASVSGLGFPSKQALLTSPCFDLQNLQNTELSFAYHMYGSTMGSLTVEVNDGGSWNQVWTLSGDQGNAWDTARLNLSAYDGKVIQVRFNAITGSNWVSDIAIDDITVQEINVPDFISAQSGNWHVGSTWVGGVAPDKQFHNVQIVSGHTVTLAANHRAHNFTLDQNAKLVLDGNEFTVSGNLTLDGNSDTTGSIILEGSSIQGIFAKDFTYNILQLNNASGALMVSGQHNIRRGLVIENGVLITNDSLRLLSDSLGTAYVAEISGGGVSGNITVERYLNESSSAFWYMVGAPVNGTDLADWNDDVFMSGFPGSNGSWGPTVYKYDVSNVSVGGDYSEGYVAPSNVTDDLNPGEGWLVWTSSSPQTIAATGSLNSGFEALNIPYNTNPTGGETKRGWALVANPYPAPVLWSDVTKINLETTEAYMSKPDGNYWACSADNIDTIYSGEAFWVQADVGSGLLIFLESDKVVGNDGYNNRLIGKPTFESPLKMELTYARNTNYSDYSVIRFGGDTNSVHFDRTYGEALKIPNSHGVMPNIASYSALDNAEIYYNNLNPADSNWTIPLYVWKHYSQNRNESFTIEFQGIEEWNDNNRCLTIGDSLNNIAQSLNSANNKYSWTVFDTVKSKYLFLNHSVPLDIAVTNVSCFNGNDGEITVVGKGFGMHTFTWKNSRDSVIYIDNSNSSSTLSGLTPGTYHVEVTNNEGCGTISSQIEVGEPVHPVISKFSMDRDTIWLNGNTQVSFSNLSSNSKDYFWSFGDGNVSDLKDPMHHYTEAGRYKVKLISENGKCRDSSQKILTVVDNVSVEDIRRSESLRIFASSKTIHVDFDFSERFDGRIELIDVLGRQLIDPIILNNVSSGLEEIILNSYEGAIIVNLYRDEAVYSEKVILN